MNEWKTYLQKVHQEKQASLKGFFELMSKQTPEVAEHAADLMNIRNLRRLQNSPGPASELAKMKGEHLAVNMRGGVGTHVGGISPEAATRNVKSYWDDPEALKDLYGGEMLGGASVSKAWPEAVWAGKETPSAFATIKKASAYEESFRKLAAFLRALYQHHQFMHWRTRGTPFYGDHLLFQRLYDKIAEELDGLAEKAIGITNNPDIIDPQENADTAAEILKGFRQTPQGSLDAEKQFVALITEVKEGLGNKLTDGLDNFLQGMADVHEGHVYLLQQRVAKEGTKEAADPNTIGVWTGNKMMWVPREAAAQTFANNPAGAVERHGTATGVLSGSTLGAAGMALLSRKAGLGRVGTGLATAAGVLGGGSFGGLSGSAASSMARKSRGAQNLAELSRHQVAAPLPVKQASLDKALGSLYVQYGPPLQKHAAATFFNYSAQKNTLDEEALGKQFCKMARASQLDPWAMASRVVKSYPNIVKMASTQPSLPQELASFYVSWGNEMLKKAGLVDTGIRGYRAAKAGVQAAIPRSSTSRMTEAVQAAKAGGPIPQPQGVVQAVKGSLAQTRALQEAGGGSIRRGEQLVRNDPSLLPGNRQPLWASGSPKAAPQQSAATTPATDATKKPSRWGNYAKGVAVLGGLGLGASTAMGGPEQYGEAYA